MSRDYLTGPGTRQPAFRGLSRRLLRGITSKQEKRPAESGFASATRNTAPSYYVLGVSRDLRKLTRMYTHVRVRVCVSYVRKLYFHFDHPFSRTKLSPSRCFSPKLATTEFNFESPCRSRRELEAYEARVTARVDGDGRQQPAMAVVTVWWWWSSVNKYDSELYYARRSPSRTVTRVGIAVVATREPISMVISRRPIIEYAKYVYARQREARFSRSALVHSRPLCRNRDVPIN